MQFVLKCPMNGNRVKCMDRHVHSAEIKVKGVETHLSAMGRQLSYYIRQCYLPPDTSERVPFRLYPARQAGTRFTYPGGMQG